MENISDNKKKDAKNSIDKEEKKFENVLILNNKEDNQHENNENQNIKQININEKESEKKQEHQNEKIEFTKKIGNYILFDQIGKGTFSKVTKAIHILTSQQVAVKILDKEKIEDEIDLERIIREIEILKNIHHPNIAQMYETYSTIHNFYLMMELVSGGDLFDFISDNSFLSENLSCHFFRQLIGVLEYLMLMGITHRDIKPENILLDENHKNIKVIDFGLSNYCENDEFLSSSCGSPCYASPEMLSGKCYHGNKTDIWSAGIVLYSMLVGSLPFDNQELYNLYEQIKKGKFYLPSTLSLEAIDLLKRILQVDPKKRIGIEEIKNHPWFNMEKNPIYKGISIYKEKFPCNKDVVEFVYENFFKNEKEINIDNIIEMVESHACNKYTSTYYLTKIYILGIEDELIMLNDNNKENKNEDKKNNNNFININNNQIKKEINEINNNEDINKLKYKERKLHESLSKDIFDKKYNDLKNNILGILDENDNENYNIDKPSINIGINKKENYYKVKNNIYNNNNQNLNKIIDNCIDNGNYLNDNKENNKIKIIKNEDLKNRDIIKEKKDKYTNINNKKNQTLLKKRIHNNNQILYISLTDRNKPDTSREKENYHNANTQCNNNKLNYNSIYEKDNYNKNNLVKQKLAIKTNNNSCNRVKKTDKFINNKKINSKNKNNISQNNNLSERYDKNKIAYFKKLNEFNKKLIQLKTLPKGNSNFNFYVINNIINKDKYYIHKKFDTLNIENKRIINEKAKPNEIKTKKKIYNRNIEKKMNREKEDKPQHILSNQKNNDKNNKHHLKIKSDQILTSFSLSTQIKMGKKINKIEAQKKINKIKVNLKSNNNLFYNKSPQKTFELNTYRKDFKKIIPKLKLENINNKINNYNQKKHIRQTDNIFNKPEIKNYYSYYTQNLMNIKDNRNQNSINNRSDSIFNANKEIKNYKRKINKKISIINRNNLRRINSYNTETKIFNHQRNLTSTSKTKLSNLKTENNSLINSHKISFIIKENMNSNKKNKVLKNNNNSMINSNKISFINKDNNSNKKNNVLKNNNNSININSSYINDYFAKDLKKRNDYVKSQENNIKSYTYKPNNSNNIENKINKKIIKKTSHMDINSRYKKYNNDKIINNSNHNKSKMDKQVNKGYCINNNQNVININMLVKQNKNKYKNRNINNNLIIADSMGDEHINLNIEQNFVPSPYFTENMTFNHNFDEKNI